MAILKQDTLTLGLLLLVALGVTGNKEQTRPYESFHSECSSNESVSGIMGFSSDKRDHIWRFICSPLPGKAKTTYCNLSDEVKHKLDEPYMLQCPGNGYFFGVTSHYDKDKRERCFRFTCCEIQNSYIHGCSLTRWSKASPSVPKYFKVPRDMILRAINSSFDLKTSYRRFRIQVCHLGYK
ncbi:dermatopontin-like isoform X2 [Pomacea canaliculata]|uniref:dermatopontin-like isoform X2 n=1 Tax=Pomacea canaliculata TaxID=400727 RepID=UPI000D72C883|nr:dermatopontin-like isoform X2 [Pomacea canaliculata]